MDQSLKSPTLENTFHAMFDASRADPAPACENEEYFRLKVLTCMLPEL
jgi:hypothetical protein